jgi:signal transduction histidine kinase
VGATGLGLSTALAIVRRQGGDMYVESREGEGTMIRVTLPAL